MTDNPNNPTPTPAPGGQEAVLTEGEHQCEACGQTEPHEMLTCVGNLYEECKRLSEAWQQQVEHTNFVRAEYQQRLDQAQNELRAAHEREAIREQRDKQFDTAIEIAAVHQFALWVRDNYHMLVADSTEAQVEAYIEHRHAELRAALAATTTLGTTAHVVLRELVAIEPLSDGEGGNCVYCGNRPRVGEGHDPLCPWQQARTLVGATTPSTAAGEGGQHG